MKSLACLFTVALAMLASTSARAQAAPTQLTIYNADFAVARTSLDLNLHAGPNEVVTTGVTRQLEPDSVILRDPSGHNAIHIAEQNYDDAVIDQQSLLKRFEGKTIDFYMGNDRDTGKPLYTQGRIVRAGENNRQSLFEFEGRLQFFEPGQPVFPASTDGLLLKPTLRWTIESPSAAHFAAELAYITGGMSWQATYNVVTGAGAASSPTDQAEITGWVTMQNHSGTDFPQARIKLMAGDVAKVQDLRSSRRDMNGYALSAAQANFSSLATEKPFDDFHLYDLHRTVSLLEGESKQVEFLTAANVTVTRRYQYDGAATNLQRAGSYAYQQNDYGLSDNTSVAIRQEIRNTGANHLGVPLPAGRMRIYRRDTDGRIEFIGESIIRHTPVEQPVSVVTGSAFDIKGTRTQTKFVTQQQPSRFTDETFSIHLTNAKKQPVSVVVVEHLYRGANWEIVGPSVPFHQVDSRTVEFPVDVPASGEATLTYQAHYTW